MSKPREEGAASLLALLLNFEAADATDGPCRFACFVPSDALDSTTTAGALLAFALHQQLPRLEIATWPFRSTEGRDVDSRMRAAFSAANFTRNPTPPMRVFAVE